RLAAPAVAKHARVANVWQAPVFRKGLAVSCLFVDSGTDIGPDRLYFLVLENTVPGRHVVLSARYQIDKRPGGAGKIALARRNRARPRPGMKRARDLDHSQFESVFRA